MELTSCPACMSRLRTGLSPWHRECMNCSYEGSVLQPAILDQKNGGDLDETARLTALESLRKENFKRVLDAIDRIAPRYGDGTARRLLDVGCAHGWFLKLASERGFQVTGIEPDHHVKRLASVSPAWVRHGFFPNALAEDEQFDVISFNDVLEHIPDIDGALEACARHLAENGLVVVNAPDRTGILYRVSKILYRLGFTRTFSRLWQKGFPSPHVHYLDQRWFQALCTRKGFEITDSVGLASVSLQGLYDRIRIDPSTSRIRAALLTVAIAAVLPPLKLAPPDIRVWLLKRSG